MCRADTLAENLFTLRKLEDLVPTDNPLRSIRKTANAALAKMDRLFAGMYEAEIKNGRPSIAPEKLQRAMLLQVLNSVPSERQLIEQVQFNLLFRWFIGLSMDDAG
jgi:transposase